MWVSSSPALGRCHFWRTRANSSGWWPAWLMQQTGWHVNNSEISPGDHNDDYRTFVLVDRICAFLWYSNCLSQIWDRHQSHPRTIASPVTCVSNHRGFGILTIGGRWCGFRPNVIVGKNFCKLRANNKFCLIPAVNPRVPVKLRGNYLNQNSGMTFRYIIKHHRTLTRMATVWYPPVSTILSISYDKWQWLVTVFSTFKSKRSDLTTWSAQRRSPIEIVVITERSCDEINAKQNGHSKSCI